MARDLTAGMQAQIVAPTSEPILLFEGVFASGTVRFWTGVGNLSWNGQTWTGSGDLIAISPVTETVEVRANGLTVSLPGIPSSLVSLILGDARSGRAGTVYLGFLSGGAVVGNPTPAYIGRLDVPTIEDSGETSTISISYESELIDLERARERRYTPEDQAIEYPGDLGFDYVASLQDAEIVWGRG